MARSILNFMGFVGFIGVLLCCLIDCTHARSFSGIVSNHNYACLVVNWTSCNGLMSCFDMAIRYDNNSIVSIILWPESCINDTSRNELSDPIHLSDMTALVIPRNVSTCQVTELGDICYSFRECAKAICKQQEEYPRNIITIMFA
jgi:hypothetical protein